MTVGIISNRQMQSIEAENTDYERNARLLAILRRKSLADFDTFLECLLKTKQHQIVSMLYPECVDCQHMQPLSAATQSRVQRNYSTLVAVIDSKNGLLTELFAEKCITWRHKEFIESAVSPSEHNKRLLEIVRRGSESDFDKFIDCLNNTGQQHVSRILLEDGVVVGQHVARISSADNEKYDEEWIVKQFMDLLHRSSTERKHELLSRVSQSDSELVAMNTSSSIVLFWLFKSLAGLHHLYELHSCGQLMVFIDELFNALKDEGKRSDVHAVTLEWDMSNYALCAQYCCSLNTPSVFSVVYELAQQSQHNVINTRYDMAGN